MKIVVTTQGTTPDSLVETRFGRSIYFLLFDSDSKQWEPVTILNEAAQAADDAGIQAAQEVARLGAHAVVANHCGRKAFKALDDARVKIYPARGLTAAEAVEELLGGDLQPFSGPDLCSLAEESEHSSDS